MKFSRGISSTEDEEDEKEERGGSIKPYLRLTAISRGRAAAAITRGQAKPP